MDINTKSPHTPIMHHTNVNEKIMGPELSVTNLFSHLMTEKYIKGGGNFLYYARAVDPIPPCW